MSEKYPKEKTKQYPKEYEASTVDELGGDREKLYRMFYGSLFFMFLGLSNPLESNLLSALLSVIAAVFTYLLVKNMLDLQLCFGPRHEICRKQDYPVLYLLEVSAWILITIALFIYGTHLFIAI